MKIEIELPSWADERNIYVMAGIELAAFKNKDAPWKIKTRRCNICGRCCMNVKGLFPLPRQRGRCPHLEKEVGNNDRYLCGLKQNRPFSCCINVSTLDFCTERFE